MANCQATMPKKPKKSSRSETRYKGLIRADEAFIDEDALREELAGRSFEVHEIHRTCYPNVVVVTGRDTGAIQDFVVVKKLWPRVSWLITSKREFIPRQYRNRIAQLLDSNAIQRLIRNADPS